MPEFSAITMMDGSRKSEKREVATNNAKMMFISLTLHFSF